MAKVIAAVQLMIFLTFCNGQSCTLYGYLQVRKYAGFEYLRSNAFDEKISVSVWPYLCDECA